MMKVLRLSAVLSACLFCQQADAYTVQRPENALKRTRTSLQRASSLQASTLTPRVKQQRGWPKRVFGKVFHRRKNAVQMQAQATATASASEKSGTDAGTTSSAVDHAKEFIRESYELGVPASLLELEALRQQSQLCPARTLSSRTEVKVHVPSVHVTPFVTKEIIQKTRQQTKQQQPQGSLPLSRVTESVLSNLFHNWSKGDHQEITIDCNMQTSLAEALFRGRMSCNAQVDFGGPINFNAIRLSGGQLEARDLALNLFSFVPKRLRKRPSPRFPKQFELLAHNATLTPADLMQSPCIRNGLRRLLTRILNGNDLQTMFVSIDDMTVLKKGILAVQGTATTILGQRVPFEVRTRLGTANNGHVMTFPGLALSLSSSFFVPILPEITVHLGPTAQLNRVYLDGESRTLQLCAKVTITPEHTLSPASQSTRRRRHRRAPNTRTERQPGGAHVDVGRWLTRLGRFSV